MAKADALLRPCCWLVATRARRRALARAAIVVALVPVVLQLVLAYLLGGDARLLPPELLRARNVLIVTAHPDDECLFFAPTILGILDRNQAIKGGLLVMSTGAFGPSFHPPPPPRFTPTRLSALAGAMPVSWP